MIKELKDLSQHKGYIPLITSRFVSNVGNGLAPVALAFGVLSIDGAGAADLSLVTAARLFPMIALLLIGGVIGDRYKRNRLVGGTDIIGAGLVAISAASFLFGFESVWLLAAIAAIFGVLTAVWWPAMSAVLPSLLPKEQLTAGNSFLSMVANTGFAIGATVAGFIVAMAGPGWAILVDAASFLIAGLIVWNMSLPQTEKSENKSMFKELHDGWKEFISRKWVVTIVVGFSVINMAIEAMYQVLGPLSLKDDPQGPIFWSFNLSGMTLGMILGSVLSLKIKIKRPLVIPMLLIAASSSWIFALALGSPVYFCVAGAVLAGVSYEFFYVNWATSLQKNVPEESYSRVVSYDAFGSWGLAPVGVAVAGPIALLIGVTPTLWLAGLAVLAVSLFVASRRSVRELH